MLHIVPDYYKDFQCIAAACRHNCCIGWEIDVDEETDAFYRQVPGPFGERLRANIAHEDNGTAHFILGKEERCPFLNGGNLCDIILTLGEEHICGICTEHPRFHNELPGRIESGLGLCCEEAARLILTRKEPMVLEPPAGDGGDEILALRNRMLSLLQDRAQPIPARISGMLTLCGALPPHGDFTLWAEDLLSLERLDEAWTERLLSLRDGWKGADLTGFDAHMAARQTEYEQFLVYLIYRHLANAPDLPEAAARAAFAAFGYALLYLLGAVQWTASGAFTPEDQIELARLFSSELEYCEENMDFLLDTLY